MNESIWGILVNAIYVLVSVWFYFFDILIIFRVIGTWVEPVRRWWIFSFAVSITEPFIRPFRRWLMRYEWARTCPLDLSFIALFVAMKIILWILQVINHLVV